MTGQPGRGRVAGAGADVASVGAASILLVLDAAPDLPPWLHPAEALCRALAALGVRRVTLVAPDGYGEEILPLMGSMSFEQRADEDGGVRHDVVLHLGNDPASAGRAASLAGLGAGTSHLASLGWKGGRVGMRSAASLAVGDAPPSAGSPLAQGLAEPIARLAAGLALQEILIVAGRLQAAAPPDPEVWFDALGGAASGSSEPMGSEREPCVIDVIGAGAIGTNLIESLAPVLGAGSELRLYDFDIVGPENLAVQSAFTASDLGQHKALVMAERVAGSCSPDLRIRAFPVRYEERSPDLSRPCLRVACPDTFAARLHLNRCSLADGVPLVEAGTSPLTAQQRSYVPGRTACLEHRIPNLARRAAEETDRAACALEPAYTLPGTTMVGGAILALEALKVLDPGRLGPPSRGTIVYDARFGARFGVVEERPPCTHPVA